MIAGEWFADISHSGTNLSSGNCDFSGSVSCEVSGDLSFGVFTPEKSICNGWRCFEKVQTKAVLGTIDHFKKIQPWQSRGIIIFCRVNGRLFRGGIFAGGFRFVELGDIVVVLGGRAVGGRG